MREVVLLHFTGDDRPGLTASLAGVLAQHGIEVLDINQTVIHRSLLMGMLVRIPPASESTNLLKIPRRMVPADEEGKPHQPGEPELPPEQIQAKIEKDRALWYKHADGLKAAALEAVQVAKARDLDGLFKVGDKVDKACEACHLEYWYPGDREAVLKDQNSKVTYDPPKPSSSGATSKKK